MHSSTLTRPISAPTQQRDLRRRQFLRSYPQVKIIVEGHCDERGSTEYNLALGDRRAQAAKDFLVSLGVGAIACRPSATVRNGLSAWTTTKTCWQQNRRAHFVLAKYSRGQSQPRPARAMVRG